MRVKPSLVIPYSIIVILLGLIGSHIYDVWDCVKDGQGAVVIFRNDIGCMTYAER